MRMKTLLGVAVALVAVALAALPSPAAEPPKNIEVLAVGVVVEVGAKTDAKWNPLMVGYPLLQGKGVRCGVTGGAVMRWFSGNVVKMRHLTSLSVVLEHNGELKRMHQDHHEIDDRLRKVHTANTCAEARRLLKMAITASREHFQGEERSVFPLLEKAMHEEALTTLGKTWMQRQTVPASPA